MFLEEVKNEKLPKVKLWHFCWKLRFDIGDEGRDGLCFLVIKQEKKNGNEKQIKGDQIESSYKLSH